MDEQVRAILIRTLRARIREVEAENARLRAGVERQRGSRDTGWRRRWVGPWTDENEEA